MEYQNLQIPTRGIDIKANVNTWALPEGAIARFGKGTVNQALAFSPDGKYLAVGTWVGVWWYEVSTLSPIALSETRRGAIAGITFSPDGKRLIIGDSDGEVKVWDVYSGVCVSQMARRSPHSQLAFSADNQHFATSYGSIGSVNLWHADTGEEVAKLSTKPEIKLEKRRRIWVRRLLCFSPDGQLLACASPVDTNGIADFISVWDMKTFEPIASIRDYTTQVETLAFSPCGKYLAVGDSSGTLKEWDIVNWKPTGKQMKTSSDYPQGYQVIPSYTISGQLRAACGSGSKIAVWNVEDNEMIDEFDYGWFISSYHFLNGTHLAVHNPLKVWIENSSDRGVTILGHQAISALPIFSPDGKALVSIGSGGSVHCWDILEKRWQRLVYDEKRSIRHVCFSPEGSMHAHGTVRNTNTGIVWNVETDETIATFTKPDTRLIVTAFAPATGYCAFGDLKGNCYVFGGEEPSRILSGHTGAINAIAFSADGVRLACTSVGGDAYVWDAASGHQVASLSTARKLDANLYTGDADRLQKILKRKIVSTKSKPGRVMAIAFSPRGDVIAGGMSHEIRLWDAITHEIRLAILLPRGCTQPYALAFTPCGRYLASGSWWGGTDKVSIRLWNVESGENTATLWSHSTDVEYLTFSPDGTLLASGSHDRTILLWDMKPFIGS